VDLSDRELLRHALAVLAYRGGKPLRGAKPEFAAFDTGAGHTPLVILAHLGDLMDWALTHARGAAKWVSAPPAGWDAEVARFFASLSALDAFLASDAEVACDLRRMLAGPVADALTHVGQLMMLRRMSGDPVYGENYFVADIQAGRVGPEQAPPVRPF
jgi:hypothetical protein